MKKLIYIFLVLLTLIACEDKPKNILSKSKMENVLYDYHMVQAMLMQLNGDSANKLGRQYIDAIFEKNNITQAEFDSSLVYYNRHSDELLKIYENIDTRLAEETDKAQLESGNNEMYSSLANGGDTTSIWNGNKLIILRNKEVYCTETFKILADTSFRSNDKYIMSFTSVFLKENMEDRDITLNVGMTLTFKDGKHIGTTRQISSNGPSQFMLNATEGSSELEHITGYFYYYGKKEKRNICIIDNISLVRMHTEEPKEAPADTIAVDSLSEESDKPEVKRLTPEEIRMQNKQDKILKIQTAPSVRRPNSIGPRRRTLAPAHQ